MRKILLFILIIFFISLFLVSLTAINFWLFINGWANLIFTTAVFFAFAIFFIGGYFFVKINKLKKENAGLSSLLEKSDKKFKDSEIEKNRASEVFTNFSEGILVFNENERISLINPAAKKILNIKTDNAKNLSVMDFGRLPEAKPLMPHILSMNGVLKEKISLKNFDIELSVYPLVFENKNSGKMVVLRDITRENHQEKTKAELMLSSIHHLKTSATSAKWSLKMLLSGDFGKINKEQREMAEKLYKRNDALIFVVNNLLEATKLEDEMLAYEKTPVDLRDIVLSAISYFEDKIKGKKINFTFKKPSQLPMALLDKDKIESVIQNLFDNALKYTGIGEDIEVSLLSDGKNIEFSIRDSGIGIPSRQQPKIFNKFFRAANANKIEATGSGLGLFIAKKIIEGHNGRLWFESEEDRGSVFYFCVPIE